METLAELEKVACIAMGSPDASAEDRQKAEQVILNFRKSPKPYEICKFILENGKNDYVLFEAAVTFKEAVIREWAVLEQPYTLGICTFLLEYITKNRSIQGFVREQILQLFAVIMKRGSLDVTQAFEATILDNFEHLIGSSDKEMLLICCSLMKALVTEYASTKESSSVGMSLEEHLKSKQKFETHNLLRILLITTKVLGQLLDVSVSSPHKRSDLHAALLTRYLSLAEQILYWRFGSNYLVMKVLKNWQQLTETSKVTLFRPPNNWKQTILDPTLPELFFRLLATTVYNEDHIHICLQCLQQLASLSGPILQDCDSRKTYLINFLTKGFFQFLGRSEWSSLEVFGCASVLNRLFFVVPVSDVAGLPGNQCKELMSILCKRTIQFQELAALAEHESSDDNRLNEAFELMLNVWVVLLSKADLFSDNYFMEYAVNIFNSYMKTHLAPPEGTRLPLKSEEEENINCDIEEDDRVAHSDTLESIGLLGREALPHTLAVLCDLLTSRIRALGDYLHKLKEDHQFQALCETSALFEDIHWLLLISTHLLTLHGPGETPTIPLKVVSYGAHEIKNSNTDISATIHHIVNSETNIASCDVDKVVQLIASAFHLAKVKMYALRNGLVYAFSPEVAKSLLTFFQRFTESYLLPEQGNQLQNNENIVAVFKTYNDCSEQLFRTLLELCEINFSKWAGEPTVLDDTVQLLLQLVKGKRRCRIALSFPNIWRMSEEFISKKESVTALPPEVLKCLVQALVTAGMKIERSILTDHNHCFFTQFLLPLKERYIRIRHHHGLQKHVQNDGVRQELIRCLDSLRGVALASDHDNYEKLNDFLTPVLEDCVSLLKEYQDFTEVRELILKFFGDVVETQLCYLDKGRSERLLHHCVLLVQTYAKHCGVGRRTVVLLEEEEQFADLLLVINILTQILRKNFFDFSEDAVDNDTLVADAAIFGLGVIIPIMTFELLRFPNLSNEYFQLLSFICEKYPSRVFCLEGKLHSGFVESLMFALNNSILHKAELIGRTCAAIRSLAKYEFGLQKEGKSNDLWNATNKQFLKVMLESIVLRDIDMDILEAAADALFALICCNRFEYQHLAQTFIAEQQHSNISSHLNEAFMALTPHDLSLEPKLANFVKFQNNVKVFIPKVKGLLFHK